MKKLVSFLLALMLLLSLTACASSEASKYPPRYEEYTSVLAMPEDAALEKLKISKSDLTEVYGIFYYTGKRVSFCGGEFDEYLIPGGVKGDGGRIIGFMYDYIVENDPKAAAQVISKVAQTLTETYGPSCGVIGTPDTNRLAEKTLEELEEWLSKPDGGANVDYWAIQSLTTPDAKDYMEKVKETSGLQNSLLEAPLFSVELNVRFNEEGKTTLTISYILQVYEYLE